jgi:hypothetical protein
MTACSRPTTDLPTQLSNQQTNKDVPSTPSGPLGTGRGQVSERAASTRRRAIHPAQRARRVLCPALSLRSASTERLNKSEGGVIRLEAIFETPPLELFDLVLLMKLDKQFPVEQFEATVSQSAVPWKRGCDVLRYFRICLRLLFCVLILFSNQKQEHLWEHALILGGPLGCSVIQ